MLTLMLFAIDLCYLAANPSWPKKNDSEKWTNNSEADNKVSPVLSYLRYQSSYLGLSTGRSSVNLEVFEGSFYRGRSMVLPNYNEFVGGDWDDKISSTKCQEPCIVIAFEDRKYEGRQRSYGSNNTFVGSSMQNTISSLVAVNKNIKTWFYTVYN